MQEPTIAAHLYHYSVHIKMRHHIRIEGDRTQETLSSLKFAMTAKHADDAINRIREKCMHPKVISVEILSVTLIDKDIDSMGEFNFKTT